MKAKKNSKLEPQNPKITPPPPQSKTQTTPKTPKARHSKPKTQKPEKTKINHKTRISRRGTLSPYLSHQYRLVSLLVL